MSIDFNALDGMGSPLWSGGGQAVQGFTYSPYGSGPARSGGMLPGFNGERLDPISQTYHLGNGYRTYNPALMRFTAPDSWSPFGAGGLNAYAYCEGDPINRTDPRGHMSWQAGVGIGLGLLSMLGTVLSLGMAIPAEGVMAGLLSLDAADVLSGGLGLAAGVTSIASSATQNSNPRASEILGWISFGLGLVSVGVHATKMVHSKLKRRPATNLLGGEAMEMQSLRSGSSHTDFESMDGGSIQSDGSIDQEMIDLAVSSEGSWASVESGSLKSYSSERIRRDSGIEGGLVRRNPQGALAFVGDGAHLQNDLYHFAFSHEGHTYLHRYQALFKYPQHKRWASINVEMAGSVYVRDNEITILRNNNKLFPIGEAAFRRSASAMLDATLINEATILTYCSPDHVRRAIVL